MANKTRYAEIAAAVEHAATPLAGTESLDKIAIATVAGEISADDSRTLTLIAFGRLKELTAEGPDAAREIILGRLVPACYDENRRGNRLRATLYEWIEQYADEQRIPLRQAVLNHVLERLPQEQSAATAWLVASIGFGAEVVKRALWESAKRDDGVGDAALAALAVIGPTVAERADIIRAVLDRMPRREMGTFDYALQELADPAVIAVLAQRLAGRGPADTIPLNHLARIATRLPGDQFLQEEIWRIVRDWAVADDVHQRQAVYFGAVIRSINSPGIIQWLLDVLRADDAGLRHIAFERLDECFMPGQVAGWSIGEPDDWIAILQRDAVRPSNAQDNWVTAEMRLRDQAWATALCIGLLIPGSWLQTAVTNEVSELAQHSVLDRAACLAFDPVPPVIAELVHERFAYARGDDTGGLFARMGAASICRSSATLGAFRLLLDSGLTVDDDVLRSTAEAVGQLAVWLTRRGVPGIDEHLFTACEQVASRHRRTLAVAGLAAMSSAALLPEGCATRLGHLAEDSSLNPYVRSAIVGAIGHLRCVLPPVTAVSALVRLATQTGQAERDEDIDGSAELALRSWDALIRLGLWRDHESVIITRLGLDRVDGQLTVSEPRNCDPQRAYLLAMLTTAVPERFADIASHVVRNTNPESFYQMIGVFRRAEPPFGGAAYELLCDAIADHVSASQGPTFADTDGFASLAEFSPKTYLTRSWEREWEDWMPIARAVYADALGVAVKGVPSHLLDRARQLLLLLVADANYAVRRAALRSFVRLDPTELGRLCLAWLKGKETGLLCRVAEAAAWLPLDRVDTLDNGPLATLASNPEPSVRAAARRETRAAQRRMWAAYNLAIVCRTRSDGNAWVIEAYRYGQALQHTGDDQSIEEINRLSNGSDLPPNVRHWLRQVAKETEKNWRKIAESWPEPIEAMGALEVVSGAVRVDAQVSNQVSVSLWQRFRQDRRQANAWGGVLSPRAGGDFQALLFGEINRVTLEIDGRSPAEITITSTFASSDGVGRVVFLGNEKYPSAL